jgi:hypothetical protein
MPSYHFSLGDSSEGPIGFCARIKAKSKKAAVARLQSMLVDSFKVPTHSDDSPEGDEYIEAYVNTDAITVRDIDEVD